MWVLVCVAEAGKMGLTPIVSSKLHTFLYLANTLAELFGLSSVRGRILKHGSSPFFPDIQRLIDYLAFSGVLSINKVDYGPKGYLSAHYSLGKSGREIYDSLLTHSDDARRTANLFRELIPACSNQVLAMRSDIGPIDANYGNDAVQEGEIVDFDEWSRDNNNMKLTNYLVDEIKALRPNKERDGVRLYCNYLSTAMELI